MSHRLDAELEFKFDNIFDIMLLWFAPSSIARVVRGVGTKPLTESSMTTSIVDNKSRLLSHQSYSDFPMRTGT
jgi:hypothetical protein